MWIRALLSIALLAPAVLTLEAATTHAGGACRGGPVTTSNADSVHMSKNCFVPTLIQVQPGTTVTWRNGDLQVHTVTGANASWGDYAEIVQGGSTAQTFEISGVYPYYCLLHPGMIGAVVVGDGAATEANASDKLVVMASPDDSPGPLAATDRDGSSAAPWSWIALTVGLVVAGVSAVAGYMFGRRRAATPPAA
jgi:plastocyanin